MAENSHISWTDHTFNPWVGCTRISPACDGCYAAALMEGRFGRVVWGEPGKGEGTRDRTKDWSKPRKWNRQAAAAPGKTFVFCASLADVFDNAVPVEWRADLFQLIRDTPNLTWLLLTKRPQNIAKLFAETITPALRRAYQEDGLLGHSMWPPNAALGTTIEDKKRLANAFALNTAAKGLRAPFTFWSCEPLLEDLGDVSGFLPDWVITGGETDQAPHMARPSDPEWYRSLRDQCAAAGVPYHHKQNGEWCEFGSKGILADGSMNFLGRPDDAPERRAYFGDTIMQKVGKDRAGRFLDGRLHDARPEVRS